MGLIVGLLVGDAEGFVDEVIDGDSLFTTEGKPEGDKLGPVDN